MNSIRSNFIWNTSYQIVRILTPIITIPYLARVLGSEALGTYSYTYTITTYFTYFCLLGLQQYGNREIAKCRDDQFRRSSTFWSIFFMQAVTGLAVIAAYFAYIFLLSGPLFVISCVWFIWVIAETVDISWFFYGMEQFKTITIRNFIVRVTLIAGIFILVHDSNDLVLYCFLQAGSFAANSLILWVMMRHVVIFVRPSWKQIQIHIAPNLKLFLPVIAISVYTQLNEIIIGVTCGMDEVAYFDNAYKVVTIPLTIIQSLGTVMLPRMSNIVSAGDELVVRRYIGFSIWLSQAMAFCLAFGIAGISPSFVPIFFGPGYEPCIQLMILLSATIPICAWSNVLGVQYLIPHENDNAYLISVLSGALANICLCALLVVPLGAPGAAIATVVAELIVSFVQSLFVKRSLPLRKYLIDTLPFFVIGIIEFFMVRLTGLAADGTVLWLVVEIVFGGLTYVAISYVWLSVMHDPRLKLVLRKS